MLPFHILGVWLRGVLGLALLGLGVFLLWKGYEEARERPGTVRVVEPRADDGADPPAEGRAVVERRGAWRPGLNRPTAMLAGGLLLLAGSLGGGRIARPLLRRRGPDDPKLARDRPDAAPLKARGGEVREVVRPDGTRLRVEMYGPPDAPPVVLTHGWGTDSTVWFYVKARMAERHRLVVWDLPGLGLSTGPRDRDWSLTKMAGDLDAVLDLLDRPAVLVGHSIGGMIGLTSARLNASAFARRVAGLVLVHTTYTNPVRTADKASLYTALQKPLIEPLLSLTIVASPVVRALSWLSYLNGSLHRSSERSGFSGRETAEQLDFVARYQLGASPAVLARGMFGMLRYDATDALPSIAVPTLVVAADEDPNCTPEASERMARDIPEASLVTLSPARHMGHFEYNGDFVRMLENFVVSVRSPSAQGASS